MEVASLPDGGRAVRDSNAPRGPMLSFTPTAWAVFMTAIRDGKHGA